MTPHGLALKAYSEGEASAELLILRDDGVEASVPARHFFREAAEFSQIEKLALERCRGRILDIGAGAGSHALALQARGLYVTALDICPEAACVMVRRGVQTVHQGDIFGYRGGPFDSLLLLGHAVGAAGTLDGLRKLLIHARQLTRVGGQILLDSLDVSCSQDRKNLDYQEANLRRGRYVGEIRLQFQYKGNLGPFCDWLQVDLWTLADVAFQTGWSCENLLEQEGGEYLARLVCRS